LRRLHSNLAQVLAGNLLFEPLANFIAHLFPEFLPARRSFGFRNIESIKYVEIFQDRITVAGHRQDAKEFVRRSARTRNLPSAYGVGTAARCQAAKLGHIRRRQRPADSVAEILAKLFQFRAGHLGYSLVGCGRGGFLANGLRDISGESISGVPKNLGFSKHSASVPLFSA
jgi:hypothetical protein